jgi:hypothetical protein
MCRGETPICFANSQSSAFKRAATKTPRLTLGMGDETGSILDSLREDMSQIGTDVSDLHSVPCLLWHAGGCLFLLSFILQASLTPCSILC